MLSEVTEEEGGGGLGVTATASTVQHTLK